MRPASKRKAPIQGTRRRCAIYTRKSSEEGLEQAFNSLDAQREACEAYIRSQRHEGWELLPTYVDGGVNVHDVDLATFPPCRSTRRLMDFWRGQGFC